MNEQQIEKELLGKTGEEMAAIEAMGESGSARRYYRLLTAEGKSRVMCVSDNIKENDTFISLSRYLRGRGLRVSEILAVTEDRRAYLLQDLGNRDLLWHLKNDEGRRKVALIEIAIAELAKFQELPEEEWRDIVEFEPFNEDLIKHDFNYAKENFFSIVGVKYDEKRLDRELEQLEKRLMDYPREGWGLMYRDFQSRNIMIKEEEAWLIDFQSSRFGPGIYDLVSFAWQAKAGFSREEREEIAQKYVNARDPKGTTGLAGTVKREIDYWAMFRIIQTLGAYGLRGLKEGKRHFIESIPGALSNLAELMERHGGEFPELRKTVDGAILEFS